MAPATKPARAKAGEQSPASLGASIIIRKGERALIVGQTGSGKTTFAIWYLRRLPGAPIVIYDTKIEPEFQKMPFATVVANTDEALQAITDAEFDYIIIRPSDHLLGDADALDDMLWRHYMEMKGVDAYIDEVYSFHKSGRGGKGLIALLTRGRSKGISTIMSTQEPNWLSSFVLSQAQRYYIFWLGDREHYKKLGRYIPEFADMPAPPKYFFYYYQMMSEKPVLYKPVKLDEPAKPDHTETDKPDDEIEAVRRHSWL